MTVTNSLSLLKKNDAIDSFSFNFAFPAGVIAKAGPAVYNGRAGG
jgi:hypothetical protein